MGERQWQEELTSHLDGTDWFIEWSGISNDLCSADLRHRLTRKSTVVHLYWHPSKTPSDIKFEIMAQLKGDSDAAQPHPARLAAGR